MNEAPASAPAAPAYDYRSHRGPYVLQGLVLALLVYGLLDGMLFNPYVYLAAPPWAGIAAAAAVALVIAALVSRGPPLLERTAICLMLAAVVALAGHTLALRINQWSDGDGPQLRPFVYAGEAKFQPLQPGESGLDFSGSAVEWPLQIGAVHVFEVVEGGLGFSQLNLQRVRKELRGKLSFKPLEAAP